MPYLPATCSKLDIKGDLLLVGSSLLGEARIAVAKFLDSLNIRVTAIYLDGKISLALYAGEKSSKIQEAHDWHIAGIKEPFSKLKASTLCGP